MQYHAQWKDYVSLPVPLAYFQMAALNNTLYIFGGTSQPDKCAPLNGTYAYNGSNWLAKSSMGTLIQHHALTFALRVCQWP